MDFNDGRIASFKVGRVIFDFLTSAAVDFLFELDEGAGLLGGVGVDDGGIALGDGGGVEKDEDLGGKGLDDGGGSFGMGGDVATTEVAAGEPLDVEADVIAGFSLRDHLVVHFDGFNLSGMVLGHDDDLITSREDTSFDAADGDGANTGDGVDVLDREAEGFIEGFFRLDDLIEGFKDGRAVIPGHVGRFFAEVIAGPTGGGDEEVVEFDVEFALDHLEDVFDVGFDFLKASLFPRSRSVIHLVDANDELGDAEGGGEDGVFDGLAAAADTSFELALASRDDEDSGVGLGGAGDHVFDEVTMAGGVDDGVVIFIGHELVEGDVDGEAAFAFFFQAIEGPGEFEGAFADLFGLLFELFQFAFIKGPGDIEDVAHHGRFAMIDVANDNQVQVRFFRRHCRIRPRLMDTSRERYREVIFMCYDVEGRKRSGGRGRLAGGGFGKECKGEGMRVIREETGWGGRRGEGKGVTSHGGTIDGKIKSLGKVSEINPEIIDRK